MSAGLGGYQWTRVDIQLAKEVSSFAPQGLLLGGLRECDGSTNAILVELVLRCSRAS